MDKDTITIKISGTPEARQYIADGICAFMAGFSEKCWSDLEGTRWGWTDE
jgi:hypothetical protein